MITRREALSSLGRGAACGALVVTAAITTQCVSTPSPAAEPDPAIQAIEHHRAVRAAWDASEARLTEDEWMEAGEAEDIAWHALTQTVPTTVAGLAAMASYVERVMTQTSRSFDQGAGLALLNLAVGAAALSSDRQEIA